jgi:prepilin-type N-terminal cleavage/methylation domain-containing protein
MTRPQSSRRGFTLIELSVVGAIVGMSFMLVTPALDKGRDGLNRRRCQDNLRQLSMAMLAYANMNGGLPPMAMSWDEDHFDANQPGPGGWFDGHGWYSLVGPHIGYEDWASLINFSISMSHLNNTPARRGGIRLRVHACPADVGLQRSEWGSDAWARVRSNYVANAGNTNYGQLELNGVRFLGAPFGPVSNTPLASITDGLPNTLMMSEIVVFPGFQSAGWAGVYSDIQLAGGGHVFTGYNVPNSSTPDGLGYGQGSIGSYSRYYAQQGIPLPIAVPGGVTATYIAPRSKHEGGINASHCDGSVTFYADGIDLAVWRALSTAQGADAPIAAATKPVRRTK